MDIKNFKVPYRSVLQHLHDDDSFDNQVHYADNWTSYVQNQYTLSSGNRLDQFLFQNVLGCFHMPQHWCFNYWKKKCWNYCKYLHTKLLNITNRQFCLKRKLKNVSFNLQTKCYWESTRVIRSTIRWRAGLD